MILKTSDSSMQRHAEDRRPVSQQVSLLLGVHYCFTVGYDEDDIIVCVHVYTMEYSARMLYLQHRAEMVYFR